MQIEEDVNVRPQQESVSRRVCTRVGVRLNMRRLQHLSRGRSCHTAPSVVSPEKIIPELLLASSKRNTTQYFGSPGFVVARIRGEEAGWEDETKQGRDGGRTLWKAIGP